MNEVPSQPAKPKRPDTFKQGLRFEELAVQFLQRKGFVIVERNFKTKFAEIDIVAKEGETLCFVEVRSRSDSRYGTPQATINFRKQEKIIKAASAYLQRMYPRIPMCRFDVIACLGTIEAPVLQYIPNAFGIETNVSSRRRGGPWQAY